MDVVSTVLRLSLGLVLITAAASKARAEGSPTRMLAAIDHRLGALDPRWPIVLNGLEFGLGIWLLIGFAIQAALATLLVTMVVFTAVLFTARARGYEGSCGCMGSLDAPVGALSMLRNLVLVALAAVALYPPVPADVSLAMVGMASLLAVVLVSVYVLLATVDHVLGAPEPGLGAVTEDT